MKDDSKELYSVVEGDYFLTDNERVLEFEHDGNQVTVSISREGYGMLVVSTRDREVERYYSLEMALDHAAELLNVPLNELEVPEEATDMGM